MVLGSFCELNSSAVHPCQPALVAPPGNHAFVYLDCSQSPCLQSTNLEPASSEEPCVAGPARIWPSCVVQVFKTH
jgi:hypothetical protein